MTPTPPDGLTRINQDDRDTAARRLQEAYADGYISHDEMEERLHQALTAKTRGELVVALDSLPAGSEPRTATIAAAGGRIKRSGAWRVPRTLKVESALGRVYLNLAKAEFEHPEVDIELALGTGRAKIVVPRDATVDIEGLTAGWKDTAYRLPRSPRSGGPTIRITGTMGFGRLRIRHARR
ncbi:DUF1707 domain-containing protein [Streptomyces sp. NPDC050658]|uniref:DUF1707 SHOCT-like domain-containing protein n=1 Tax=unclassified Streptomyces TaxID=2593676 RepID=UPI003420F5E4